MLENSRDNSHRECLWAAAPLMKKIMPTNVSTWSFFRAAISEESLTRRPRTGQCIIPFVNCSHGLLAWTGLRPRMWPRSQSDFLFPTRADRIEATESSKGGNSHFLKENEGSKKTDESQFSVLVPKNDVYMTWPVSIEIFRMTSVYGCAAVTESSMKLIRKTSLN